MNMVRLRLALQQLIGTRTALTAVVLVLVVIVAALAGWLDPITNWWGNTFGVDNQ